MDRPIYLPTYLSIYLSIYISIYQGSTGRDEDQPAEAQVLGGRDQEEAGRAGRPRAGGQGPGRPGRRRGRLHRLHRGPGQASRFQGPLRGKGNWFLILFIWNKIIISDIVSIF